MKPCGYYRISSKEAALDTFAATNYRQKLIGYGVKEEDIFFDFSSGGDTDRQEYQRMLGLISQGSYDRVVVPMQSRLNRSMLNSELFAEQIATAGAKITILESGVTLDPLVPEDRFRYQLNAMMDHHALSKYKLTNSDNASSGRQNKKMTKVPFGYKIVRGKPRIDRDPYVCTIEPRKTLSASEVLLQLIEAIVEYRSYSQGIRQIHQLYGIPKIIPNQVTGGKKKLKQFDFTSDRALKHKKPLHFTESGIKTLISNPILRGDLEYFWRDKNKDTLVHPQVYKEEALITASQFQELQAICKSPKKYIRTGTHLYPYTGLVYCALCGARCYSDLGWKLKSGKRNLYYFCKNLRKGCKGKRIKADAIEKVIVAELTAKFQSISNLAYKTQNCWEAKDSPEIMALVAENRQIELLNSENPLILQAIKDNKIKIEALRQQKLGDNQVKLENLEVLQAVFANPLYWETLGIEDKREINKILISRIAIGLKDERAYIERIDLLV